MSGETVHGRGAGTGLANTAKYGDTAVVSLVKIDGKWKISDFDNLW
jgi:hypothetical protein